MESPTSNTNYCPNCGSLLGQSVNYCSQCGTQCREVVPASDSGADSGGRNSDDNDRRDADLLAFRRRVQARLLDGWDLEHDHGDSVVLVDRGIGSPWVHAPLLLFTGGVGNLVYGWYNYSHNANRMMIQADGSDHPTENIDLDGFREKTDDGGSVGSYILGSVLLLIAVAVFSSAPLSLFSVVLSLLVLLGSAWTFPPIRRRLKNRHPITRFGPVRSTDERTVIDPIRACVVCGSPIETGIKRTYREEYALAGIPLFTTETGENHYCQKCTSSDMDDTGVTPMDSEGPTEHGRTTEVGHEE